jgi:hypothetical protein
MSNTHRRIMASKEDLRQWYQTESRSYRWIMNKLGCGSARAIKRLLKENGIEIRHGSAAIKTQWINAKQRRIETSKRAKENLPREFGYKHKKETIIKMSEVKLGNKNPMWGIKGKDHHHWLGGSDNWRFGRKIRSEKKKQIIKTLGGKCKRCDSTKNLTINHNPPWRVTRSHELKFLEVLCKKCHFSGPNHLR